MHKKNRLLALFMVFVLLFTSVGFTASAETMSAATPTRVSEVESLRETNSETYLMSDGSYECVVYAYDKYYKAPDNTLQLTNSKIVPATAAERSGKLSAEKAQYKNAANAFDVHFSGSGTPEISVAYQGAAVTFSPITSGKNTATFSLGKVNACKTLDKLTYTGDNTVTYNNAFPDADLVYILENNALKEYIILNSTGAGNTFSFLFSLDGVTLQSKDKYAEFTDRNGTVLFSLDSLFAVDANGVVTENLTYTFTPVKDTNKVTVTVTLDKEYFSSADRVFPIIIDPTVMISSTETADACVCSYTPNTNYRLNTRLRTGMDDEYGKRRSFIKFNIPDSITDVNVDSARIEMEKVSGVTPTVRAYMCVSNWSSSTITWNNMPTGGDNYAYASTLCTPYSATSSWYVMDVTNIVTKWVGGIYPNYGFIIRDDSELDVDHWTTWYSSDAASPHKPELYITYSPLEEEDPEPEPEPVPFRSIRFYGVTITDHTDHPSNFDHNDGLREARNLFDSYGYTDNALLTGYFDPETFKDQLDNATIVTTFSHGYAYRANGEVYATGLLLNEKSSNKDDWWLFMNREYSSETYEKFAYIRNADDFSNLDLVVFVGCETALAGSDGTSLTSRIVERGAQVAVGFEHEIECIEAGEWTRLFYNYFLQGYSVYNANRYAKLYAQSSETTSSSIICGNANYTIS